MFSFMKKKRVIALIMLLPYILFFNPVMGTTMVAMAEVLTLGKADCRVYSEEIPMRTCTSSPKFLHFSGGTVFGDTFITSGHRANLTDPLMRHEAVHAEQGEHYGIMFIPLYLNEQIKPGCNNFEEEASFVDAGYKKCIGTEKYHQ